MPLTTARPVRFSRYTKFQGVNSVTFHFPNSLRGSGKINVHFLGLKGACIRAEDVRNTAGAVVPVPSSARLRRTDSPRRSVTCVSRDVFAPR